MTRSSEAPGEPINARVVHSSIISTQASNHPVTKLMLNLARGAATFSAGMEVAIAAPGAAIPAGLRYFTVEEVGPVPFEDSVDITLYVRGHVGAAGTGMSSFLGMLPVNQEITLYGPFRYPFYPPSGSRSNLILIGAGAGVVPFRWLARKIHARGLDWMGKVLILEGEQTGMDHLYLNHPGINLDQYFDSQSQRAFDALKTRYSATMSDAEQGIEANMDAVWRLLGQPSVYVYRAGYRKIAEAMDAAMDEHLRMPGRWQEAREALIKAGHWQEVLYG